MRNASFKSVVERGRRFICLAIAGFGCVGCFSLGLALRYSGHLTSSPTSLPTCVLYVAVIAGLVFQRPLKAANKLPGRVRLARMAYIAFVLQYMLGMLVLYAVQSSGCFASWLAFVSIYCPFLLAAVAQAVYPWSDLAAEATELSSAVARCEAHVLSVIEGGSCPTNTSSASLEMETWEETTFGNSTYSSSHQSLLALLCNAPEASELEHVGSIFRQLIQVLDEFSVRVSIPAFIQVVISGSCFVVDVVLWEQGLKHHELDIWLVCFDSPLTHLFPSCRHPSPVQAQWLVTYLELCFMALYAMQALVAISSAMCITHRAAKLREKIALSPAAFRPSGHPDRQGCDSVDILCILKSCDARPIGVRVCGALVTHKAAAYILFLSLANCAARLLVS